MTLDSHNVGACNSAWPVTLTDSEREALAKCLSICDNQLQSAIDCGDEDKIHNWRSLVEAFSDVLER